MFQNKLSTTLLKHSKLLTRVFKLSLRQAMRPDPLGPT